MTLYPLRFEPIFQYRLWGGRLLESWMNTSLPDGPVGEAWILSDRADHTSVVAEGALKGRTLTELMSDSKVELLGDVKAERFPLLLKFLDVRQLLSVQVHPADDMKAYIPDGESGKTEAWVVLRADPGSRIYAGLTPGTTADDLRHLTAKTAAIHLSGFKLEAGQGVEIDAGTVHSLGDGICKLRDVLNIPIERMLFIGDALFPGGNDYPAEETGAESIRVRDPLESTSIIQAIVAFMEPT